VQRVRSRDATLAKLRGSGGFTTSTYEDGALSAAATVRPPPPAYGWNDSDVDGDLRAAPKREQVVACDEWVIGLVPVLVWRE